MFSLDSFYKIISKNLLEPINCESHYFKIFGSTEPNDLDSVWTIDKLGLDELAITKYVIFYDQEPMYSNQFDRLYQFPQGDSGTQAFIYILSCHTLDMAYFKTKFYAIANSEHSKEKDDLLEKHELLDWYYFFHGFAALDWYKNVRYLPPIKTFSKVFISFNNLINEKRSYRLTLISMLLQRDLEQFGYISMTQQDTAQKIKNELYSPHSLLSKESKYLIHKTLLPNPPLLVIDTDTTIGTLSANDNLDTLCLGLFHVVTETIFYDEKLHLTEKIFKPIVARRPFFLVGAPGNLAYLKSYGFKTFDHWIDESYDSETEPDQRLVKIVNELDKLCKLSESELAQLYNQMQDILEYNFNWFYTGFREQITNELVNNFELLVKKYNAGKDTSFKNYINASNMDFDAVKKLLLQ
jgi:hypothetical protein